MEKLNSGIGSHGGSVGSGGSSPLVGTQHTHSQYFFTRQSKVYFPHFNGEDLNGWLFRCTQFFDIDNTPQEMKVKLASINLEGKALAWHQNWVRFKSAEMIPWEIYVAALEQRFGEMGFKDPMSELLQIKQSGKVS